ncbi:hypothetical protein BC628DRAFT_634237 [Trametes gibbosa]|nr:hypothetical protein BC628DRAFT_634237 [Trametes gibbosa]
MVKKVTSRLRHQDASRRQDMRAEDQEGHQESTHTALKPRKPPRPHQVLVKAIGSRKVASYIVWDSRVPVASHPTPVYEDRGTPSPKAEFSSDALRHQTHTFHVDDRPGTPLVLLQTHRQWLRCPSPAVTFPSAPIDKDVPDDPDVSRPGTAQGEVDSRDVHQDTSAYLHACAATGHTWAPQSPASGYSPHDGTPSIQSEDLTDRSHAPAGWADPRRDHQVLSQASSYASLDPLAPQWASCTTIPQEQSSAYNIHPRSHARRHAHRRTRASQHPGDGSLSYPSTVYTSSPVPRAPRSAIRPRNAPGSRLRERRPYTVKYNPTDKGTAQAVLFDVDCQSIGPCASSAHVQFDFPYSQQAGHPSTLAAQMWGSHMVDYGHANRPLQGVLDMNSARVEGIHPQILPPCIMNTASSRRIHPSGKWTAMASCHQSSTDLSAPTAPGVDGG